MKKKKIVIFGVKYKVNNKTINTESVIDKLDNLV